MIEVFKTNVMEQCQAELLVQKLSEHNHDCLINFDLEDCDKVLRIDSRGKAIDVTHIISLVKTYGYSAEVLPD